MTQQLLLQLHSAPYPHSPSLSPSLSFSFSFSVSVTVTVAPNYFLFLCCRILFRDYGANCKVVGIADGFGVAEDPNGLDSEELLRLVKESLPITSFKKVRETDLDDRE